MVRSRPEKVGNHAVTAEASPSSASATTASRCSRNTSSSAMTPTASNPGISRTVCSQPISLPVNPATSMTKLLSKADHVAKLSGIAAARR